MYKTSNVSLLFFSFFIILVLGNTNTNEESLLHFGIKILPFGYGYNFDNLIKLKIKIAIEIKDIDFPNKLDCGKYVLKNQQTASQSRRKRETLMEIQDGVPLCAYKINELSGESKLESEREENRWQNLKAESIYCDNSYSNNCLLRVLHYPNASIYWYKKYNWVSRKFFIEPSYIIYNPPKNITITKEIMYRTITNLDLAKQNKPIQLAYHCLGNPYENQGIKLDPMIKYINDHREKLVMSNLGNRVSNISIEVPSVSKEQLIEIRSVIDELPPATLKEWLIVDYSDYNNQIKSELLQLNRIESEVTNEVIKLEQKPILTTEENKVSKLCMSWFKQKDTILELYKKRDELTKNVSKNIKIEMSKDLQFVCANAALLQLQYNAIERVNHLELEEIQKEILTLLGIKYDINSGDQFRIDSKIEKFKNLPVYDGFKAEIIEVNKQRFKLNQEISRLNVRVAQLRSIILKEEDAIDKLEEKIRVVENRTELNQFFNQAVDKKRKGIEINRNNTSQAIIDLATQLAEKLINLKQVRSFSLPSNNKSIVLDLKDDESSYFKKLNKFNSMINKLDKIEQQLEMVNNQSQYYVELLLDSNQTLADLSIQLKNNSIQREAQVKNVEELNGKIKKLQKDLEDQNNEWNDKYETLFREKRDVETKLKIYADNATLSQQANVDYTFLKTKVNKLEGDVKNSDQKLENVLREKRSIQEKLGINLFNHCENINQNIQQIIDNLNTEKQKLDGGIRSRKKRVPYARWLNAIWKSASYGLIGGEFGHRLYNEHILTTAIVRNYEEYLKHAKLESDIQSEMSVIRTNVDKNLDSLNKYAKNASEGIQNLVDELNEQKEYEIANRVFIVFYSDILAIQRLLINFVQQNGIKNRILESMAILRSGMLPQDFISRSELSKLLDQLQEKMPNGLKLAFNSSHVDLYYQYPFSSFSYENDEKFIELRLPAIYNHKELQVYNLYKLRNYPINCWDAKICNSKDNFKLKLNHNILFTINGKDTVSTAHLNDLECMMYFDNKLCWRIERDANNIDTCLNGVLSKNQSLVNCEFEKTTEKVIKLNLNSDKLYETYVNEKGVLVGKMFNIKDNTTQEHTIYEILGNMTLIPKSMFAKYSYEVPTEYKESMKKLNDLDEAIKSQANFYKNRTVEDMLKETGLDKLAVTTIENSNSRFLDKIFLAIPYLIGIAVLVYMNNFITLGMITVTIEAHGTHAANIGEAVSNTTTQATNTLANELLNQWKEKAYSYITSLMGFAGTIIILIIIGYIISNILYKKITIRKFYGKVRNIRSMNKTAWYILTTTLIERNTLFGPVREIVNLAFETSYNIQSPLFTPVTKSVWLKEGSALSLFEKIQVHFISEQSFLLDEYPIHVDEHDIKWNYNVSFDLNKLHGVVTSIRTVRLSDVNHVSETKM